MTAAPVHNSPFQAVLDLADEAATNSLAESVSGALRPGDLVTLQGDLGSGKTTFARHLIRTLSGNAELEVPSPTFTLVQNYETPRGHVVHADLYRLGDPSELAEIGWDEIGGEPIVLVEWPERAGEELSHDRLALELKIANSGQSRQAVLEGHGSWAARLKRLIDIGAFTMTAGWVRAERQHIQGDASTRRYERLVLEDRTAVLMDAPRRPDGPPVRDGKPYSQIAHLAEDVLPFAAMAEALIEAGLSAPAIIASDLDRGLLLIEDFGTTPLLVDGAYTAERITAAADALLHLHLLHRPDTLHFDRHVHHIPDYDLSALLIETELLLDWYLPHHGRKADAKAREDFRALWSKVLIPITTGERTWTLRDYHSPNLMWLPERDGVRRVGVLDFQDAVMGHPAYDVVSLLQDARVDIAQELELGTLTHYVGARRAVRPDFDPAAFARAYAVLGAQRATKILGIFVRLSSRDGKNGYMKHLPRLRHYLRRNLLHPALAELKAWYDETMPELQEAR